MLLVYAKIFGQPKISLDAKIRQPQITASPSEKELQQGNSQHFKDISVTEEIRKIRQQYYLERRFFL